MNDSLLAQNHSLLLNHNSGASFFPKKQPPYPFYLIFSAWLCLAIARRKQTITVSERASQETGRALLSSALSRSPVIITGNGAWLTPSVHPSLHFFFFFYFHPPPSSLFLRASSESPPLCAHVFSHSLRAYQPLQENPLRSAPPSPLLAALTHS